MRGIVAESKETDPLHSRPRRIAESNRSLHVSVRHSDLANICPWSFPRPEQFSSFDTSDFYKQQEKTWRLSKHCLIGSFLPWSSGLYSDRSSSWKLMVQRERQWEKSTDKRKCCSEKRWKNDKSKRQQNTQTRGKRETIVKTGRFEYERRRRRTRLCSITEHEKLLERTKTRSSNRMFCQRQSNWREERTRRRKAKMNKRKKNQTKTITTINKTHKQTKQTKERITRRFWRQSTPVCDEKQLDVEQSREYTRMRQRKRTRTHNVRASFVRSKGRRRDARSINHHDDRRVNTASVYQRRS